MLTRCRERRKLWRELQRIRKERNRIFSRMTKMYAAYRYEFCLLPEDMQKEYDESAAQVLDLNLRITELTDRINDI
jgi:uncharacterized coiled-coil DUF342 family protein